MRALPRLALFALSLLCGSYALAADMDLPRTYLPTDPPASSLPPPPEEGIWPVGSYYSTPIKTYDWTGFYAGAFVGGTCLYGGSLVESGVAYGMNGCGPFAGGLAGYNYQIGNYVLGAEVDAGTTLGFITNTDPGGQFTLNQNLFGSARLRAGYALGSTLLYGTAGLAATQGDLNSLIPNSNPNNVTSTQLGYTVGVGVEQGIVDHVRLRAEYRFTEMGGTTYTCPTCNAYVNWGGEHGARIAAIYSF